MSIQSIGKDVLKVAIAMVILNQVKRFIPGVAAILG